MSVSVARRPLLTATAAGTLLCALWFVPSANASAEQGAVPERQRQITTVGGDRTAADDGTDGTAATGGTNGMKRADGTDGARGTGDIDRAGLVRGSDGVTTAQRLRLAETGSFDTTPYLVGGTAFLGVGIGFVTYAVRRRDSSPM
ncbi:hypothetical protein [Streptomyces clavuligerus]|uniref:Uncharacterized protein n=1 Tax=Streptomyces clavuligerus TaxID=1901 RepID=B5GSV9_STRCL|nr:hypothetical protein [Streptomyces clavuligerus]ANW18455.1 hypothetical protein BB341_09515 [Streptomyces clavuligerus]AXU13011.1 hypothetical protein D1794_09850 [Streptomyces clavuligerus]EDY49405.1 hypothetical protein SSCG_02433 [Streptomyces clavuligerus]EFG08913.1 Hypothetical protein SCLAV_3841 [Streptomyces clavuligerus]MBY6302941.1 hypothetical protein [Streptomyces clavuligerus]